MSKDVRRVAVYYPQFHPTLENSIFWGRGFTDWDNVKLGRPRFEGHYQPHVPSLLGYYDLRRVEARMAQEALARQYNIFGFCYYHYWLHGKHLLHEPIDRKMGNPKEDLPFMLCWANHDWARSWNGGNNEIMIQQKYSIADDKNHIQFLLSYFKDPRYIKVNGKPIFAFYNPNAFPNMSTTVRIFREEARKDGIELYLCWFDKRRKDDHPCFDAAIEHQPLSKSYQKYQSQTKKIFPGRKDEIWDYGDFAKFDVSYPKRGYKCFPCVCPMWDNTARRRGGGAIIFRDSTPELFGDWYRGKVDAFAPYSEEENFIFISAWNEWAEGNHLEPCEKWGTRYLEATL